MDASKNEKQFAEVIKDLEMYQEKTGETWDSLAKQMDVNPTALSAAKSGKYQGDLVKMQKKIEEYLAYREIQKKHKKLEFPPTDTQQMLRIVATLQVCHQEGECGVIYGPAGVGKSSGLYYFQAKYKSQVYLVEAGKGMQSTDLLDEFLDLFSLEAGGQQYTKQKLLINHIKGKPWLLIVDEAHYLSTTMIEVMRRVFDKTGVPVVFCGNDTVIGQMRGKQKVFFSHVFSRLPNRCAITAMPSKEDIEKLCLKAGVEVTKEVLIFLYRWAQGEGHYRDMFYLLKKALKEAAERNEALSVKHLKLIAEVNFGVKIETEVKR